MLHPLIAKNDHQRRLVMNSIGPLWDGNEVWLLTLMPCVISYTVTIYRIFSGKVQLDPHSY